MLIPEQLHEDFLAFVDDEGTAGHIVAIDLYERWVKAIAPCEACGHPQNVHEDGGVCWKNMPFPGNLGRVCSCEKFVPKPESVPDSAT